MSKILKEALDKLDEKILPVEIKESIIESFNEAVTKEADALVESKIESIMEAKELEYNKTLDEYMDAIVESFKQDQESKINEEAKTISEGYINEAKKQLEESYESQVKEITENINGYVNLAVKQLVEKAEPVWNDEVTVAKANDIISSFGTLSKAFGVKFVDITATVDDKAVKLQESLDASIKESIEKDAKINEMTKELMVKEALDALQPLQADKLAGLLKESKFESEEQFKGIISNYTLLVKGIDEKVTEPKEPKKVEEKTAYVPSYMRGKK